MSESQDPHENEMHLLTQSVESRRIRSEKRIKKFTDDKLSKEETIEKLTGKPVEEMTPNDRIQAVTIIEETANASSAKTPFPRTRGGRPDREFREDTEKGIPPHTRG